MSERGKGLMGKLLRKWWSVHSGFFFSFFFHLLSSWDPNTFSHGAINSSIATFWLPLCFVKVMVRSIWKDESCDIFLGNICRLYFYQSLFPQIKKVLISKKGLTTIRNKRILLNLTVLCRVTWNNHERNSIRHYIIPLGQSILYMPTYLCCSGSPEGIFSKGTPVVNN